MSFIELTLTNEEHVLVNLIDVTSIEDCGDYRFVIITSTSDRKNRSGYHVQETLYTIKYLIKEALGD